MNLQVITIGVLALAGLVVLVLALVDRPQRGILLLACLVPFDGLLLLVPHPGLVDGWKEGLVGKTAGSRVLLVVPPAQAYPDGLPSATPSLAAGQTLVYVIDILNVQG